jgi:hypothetical protein
VFPVLGAAVRHYGSRESYYNVVGEGSSSWRLDRSHALGLRAAVRRSSGCRDDLRLYCLSRDVLSLGACATLGDAGLQMGCSVREEILFIHLD